jgi:hypothetical protein
MKPSPKFLAPDVLLSAVLMVFPEPQRQSSTHL